MDGRDDDQGSDHACSPQLLVWSHDHDHDDDDDDDDHDNDNDNDYDRF